MLRRRQHHGTVPNRYPARGPGPPPPQQVSQYRHYNPRPQYNRSPPRIRHHGYDTKPDTFDDNGGFRQYQTRSPVPSVERRSIEPNKIGSRSMDDIRRKRSLDESPKKKRLTASEERLTDIHKQWELGTKFHVAIRVRPMTVREIKESSKVNGF